MSKNISDLRDGLFDAIALLKEGKLTMEQAMAISEMGQVIINSAKVEVDCCGLDRGRQASSARDETAVTKYAKEVIDLMAAYPGRQFRMAHMINHIDRGAQGPARLRIRVGTLRVLKALSDNGQVVIVEPETRGGSALYQWQSDTSTFRNLPQSDRGSDTLGASRIPS